MSEIDPVRAFSLLQILERGDSQEKLALINDIEADHSVAPGLLLRLVLDESVDVRRAALAKLGKGSGLVLLMYQLVGLRRDSCGRADQTRCQALVKPRAKNRSIEPDPTPFPKKTPTPADL